MRDYFKWIFGFIAILIFIAIIGFVGSKLDRRNSKYLDSLKTVNIILDNEIKKYQLRRLK